MNAPSSLSATLDAAERAGHLNLRLQDLRMALPGVSPDALRQSLHRQQRRGRLIRLSRGAEHWLIVPLQYAVAGAPPLETWLDRYMSRTLGIAYHVGMLSAAEIHGASPWAVMVTQVMVAERRRSITVGRHQLLFHVSANIERLPTRWHETPDGRFRVATPELTALQIVQRETHLGGMERVHEVLRGLYVACTPEGLIEALEAMQEVPTAQRLGSLMALDSQESLAASVAGWLAEKKTRIVPLERTRIGQGGTEFDSRFKVQRTVQMANAGT
jgi:predicted transcriptional regulator of viral defense system